MDQSHLFSLPIPTSQGFKQICFANDSFHWIHAVRRPQIAARFVEAGDIAVDDARAHEGLWRLLPDANEPVWIALRPPNLYSAIVRP